MDRGALRQAAIGDNIGWCSAVCAAHGSNEIDNPYAWVNRAPSPRFYPNVITRLPKAQAAVTKIVHALRQRPEAGEWSIKDSFRDLDLASLGFAPVIEAQWYGGHPMWRGSTKERPWECINTLRDLARWAGAWGEGVASHPFKDTLLADERIRFWRFCRGGQIAAGGISYASGSAIGLSNWFSGGDETVFTLGLTDAIADAYPGLPIVFWSAEREAGLEELGLKPLGGLRVWTG